MHLIATHRPLKQGSSADIKSAVQLLEMALPPAKMLYETNEIYNLPARVSIVIDRLRSKVYAQPYTTDVCVRAACGVWL